MRRGRPMRVHIVVLHDCAPIVPVGAADLLRKVIELAGSLRMKTRPIELALVAAGKARMVRTGGGIQVRCDRTLADAGPCDVVLIPALDPDIDVRLARNAAVIPWVRRSYARGADVVSACTGSFLLAEAGLLDGRSATTHWAFQELFRKRYPNVHVEPQAIVVDQGRVVTAGGATSFINLVLFLVERMLGQDVARAASKMFLIDPNKSPQGAYAVFSSQKDHGDAPILRAQEIIEREFGNCPSVEQIARRVALSRRTFVRRFQAATGNSPRGYTQRVRVEAAKRGLEGGDSIATVAARVGYDDVIAFRKLFRRTIGLTPAEYRSRYGPARAMPTT